MSKKSKIDDNLKAEDASRKTDNTQVYTEEAVGKSEEASPGAEATSETEASSTENVEDIKTEEQEDYREQYLRLRADFENFRKRTRREKEEWTQRCLENLCSDLLTVLDHFDLGIENSKGKEFTEDTLKGFELVRGQLSSTLGAYGLKVVEVEGGAFDPNLHEAITHMPSPEVKEGDIVAVTRKGYQLGGRLLRPTQVVVSAGSPETRESEPGGEA